MDKNKKLIIIGVVALIGILAILFIVSKAQSASETTNETGSEQKGIGELILAFFIPKAK